MENEKKTFDKKYEGKKVLLIAGGGTLGSYTAKELLSKGAYVDIICLEDNESDNEMLTYYKHEATVDYLKDLFSTKRYDGVVNFIHYKKVEDYIPYHELIIKNTDHLIFLSSYRVYADEQHPITEDAPRLLDTTDDAEFLEKEDYALAKARGEDFLKTEHYGENWTIVRPVISFSYRRFDLFTYSRDDIWAQVERFGKLPMPRSAKDLGAGIDWAGNSGKLIANLLFKKEAFGEAYTVSSAQNLTWGQLADIYAENLGFEVTWCEDDEFEQSYPSAVERKKWLYFYDRKFDRTIDNSKILKVTGLGKDDFIDIAEGLKTELAIKDRMERNKGE